MPRSRIKDYIGRMEQPKQRKEQTMSFKRPFDDVMREFREKYPDEVDQLRAEQIAERTEYSLSTVREYLSRKAENKKEAHIRAKESNAVTYVTSSGKATVVYYPLIGDVKITSHYDRRQPVQYGWREGHSLLLSPQDSIEIGIYLLGLQPHIRDVIARKDKVVPQDVQEVEYPTPDMAEQDL